MKKRELYTSPDVAIKQFSFWLFQIGNRSGTRKNIHLNTTNGMS